MTEPFYSNISIGLFEFLISSQIPQIINIISSIEDRHFILKFLKRIKIKPFFFNNSTKVY